MNKIVHILYLIQGKIQPILINDPPHSKLMTNMSVG